MQLLVTISLAPLFFSSLVLCASVDSSATAAPETVIADVNGSKITLGEFEAKRANSLLQARNAFYFQERQVLEGYIDDYILKQQAQKEGISVDQLLDREVKSKLPKDPSDEALHVYYEGVDTKESFEALRGKILDRIRQVRFDKAKAAYVQTLRSQAKVVVNLPPPKTEIVMANTPVLGDQNAPVMFVEYADYECPVCQQVAPTVHKLKTEYKGRVAFAFKDYPLPQHPRAEKAAEAARCAGTQGKYWDYHDQLFATKKLEIADLKADAQKLNLDMAAFNKCLDSGSQAEIIKSQFAESQDLGLQGTPTFFINGHLVNGSTYEQLRGAIEEELATTSGNQPKQTAMR